MFSDRVKGVKEAPRAEVGPREEMARMATMVSLGYLVLQDSR